MTDPESAPGTQHRPDAILDAAFHAFATYGFRRATMDDIAQGAGMSRSALYLHYRNKEDIFRSLTQRYFAVACADMTAALAVPGRTAEAALLAAFIAKDGKFMDVVLGTPHGSELMDAGFSISGDIAAQGESRLAVVLADWLRARGLPEGLGTAEDVAGAIMAALKGIKTGAAGIAGYRAGQAQLARLFGRAIGG